MPIPAYHIYYDGLETKYIIKTYEKVFSLFKDFRYIIYGYNYAIEKYKLSFCDKTNTERLINNIESIFNNFEVIFITAKTSKEKEKLSDLVDTCLLNLRVFKESMDDYIINEYNIWEFENCRGE